MESDLAGSRTATPALQLAAARGIAQLGLAVATIAIARYIGVDGLGRYAFFTAAGSIGVASIGSGLAIAGTRDQATGRRWSPAVVVRLMPLLAPGALGALATAVAVQGPTAWRPAAIAVASYACSGWMAVSSALACGVGRFSRAAVGEAAAGVALPALTIAALAAGTGIAGSLGAIGVASLLGALIMGPVLQRGEPVADRTARSSLPFVFIGLASAGYARLDALAVRVMGGEADLGLYSAAYRLLGPVLVLASAFGSVFFAQVVRQRQPVDVATLRRGSLVLAALLVPVVLVEAAAAGWIVGVLYGPGFEASVGPARVLLLAAFPLAVYWPVAHALNARGHERTWATLLGVAAVGDALLAGWWVAWWGPLGAAAAWVTTEILLAAAVLVVGRRVLLR